ncbi:hypothetical protein Acr_23g0014990 [Actinidia rufa]|uniref:RNase H type-1 domain-containing protein n=1 Tax=Actinidia rufa TaxID=165716 RepID=A0A7J0GR59_9ERIC|nr:hypothetical protein Acr_23g0014990 [Actinidia rufa]
MRFGCELSWPSMGNRGGGGPYARPSPTWRGMLKGYRLFQEGTSILVNNGEGGAEFVGGCGGDGVNHVDLDMERSVNHSIMCLATWDVKRITLATWDAERIASGRIIFSRANFRATPGQQQQGDHPRQRWSVNIGHTHTSAATKLWGLRDTRQIALDKGFRNIEIEFDAKAVIQLIHNTIEPTHHLRFLILDCRFLMRELGLPVLMHTFREGNSCADLLAGEGFHIQEG